MSLETRKTLVSALIGAVVGILGTGFLSMLLVGSQLHALENNLGDRIASLGSRVASLETAVQYIRADDNLNRR